MVMACTFAPATTPLCAIGVAMEIPLAQLWPGPPGMLEGKRSVTVGTFQLTSPISSLPPPVGPMAGPSGPSSPGGGSTRGGRLYRETAPRLLELFLQAFRHGLIVIRPLRQAHFLDVLVHGFGDRAVEVPGP